MNYQGKISLSLHPCRSGLEDSRLNYIEQQAKPCSGIPLQCSSALATPCSGLEDSRLNYLELHAELVCNHNFILLSLQLLSPPCSGLEDSRLNYIEQHAERLGLDAGRLEGARVAASQGGLAGETLDLCARWA